MAKLKNNSLSENMGEKLENLYDQNIELGYYTSTIKISKEKLQSRFYHLELVSTRIPIVKEMVNKTIIHPNISLYEEQEPSEDLISLALLAGQNGRFGNDPRISKEVYRKLFECWIRNSIKKVIADEVLVYKVDEEVVGFATIKIDGNTGYAPLLAVKRKYEGKGVSFAIMRAIETRLIENECKYVLSGTQEINKKALSTFKRYGLQPQPAEYIYHLWRK
ncbi:GNAT family N-acetyltransferase [Salinimicrobium terrae]|uniref:GNAT family N-acetyltransferase n=1 Tax=Salinimicrobium terrae TaxID=470866 RepID=UPI00146B8146|nr:GNAT family N-acetyltransferase [Salinimicrobium terrae]